MEDLTMYEPGHGERHSTQIISLLVGILLTILGASGILFPGFAGLHLSAVYSTIIAIGGMFLFYSGYKNRGWDAFFCCLGFAVFFGIHAFAGWMFGEPGVPSVGFDRPDPNWISIIPGFHELGRSDHILNSILTIVLFGGAVDWFRRNSEKGHRVEMMKRIPREYRELHRASVKPTEDQQVYH